MSIRPALSRFARSARLSQHQPLQRSVFRHYQPRSWQSTSSLRHGASWTTGRGLLMTAFASSLAYVYGITDAGSHLEKLWRNGKIPRYGSANDLNKAIAELRAALGKDRISTDDDELQAHGYSEWSSINISQLPVAVAYPKSTNEVSQIAKVCHKYRMPMIPYSGGSSLEANFSAPRRLSFRSHYICVRSFFGVARL